MPLRNEEYMVGLIRKWAAERCLDFGEAGSQHLYESFKSWVYEHRAMRRFPGQAAFGMAMKLAGYEKLRIDGITHWSGIALKATRTDRA